jgi:hypothetical protein
VRRSVLLALGLVWAVTAAHALARAVAGEGGLLARLPAAAGPAARRAMVQTGDPVLRGFLDRTRAAVGGAPRLAVLANARDGQDTFRWYRSAFELFPERVWYLPVPGLRLGAQARLDVEPATAALVRTRGIRHAAYFNGADPGRHGWYALSVPGDRRLVLDPLAAPLPRPPDPPASPWRWILGLLVLCPLGFALSVAVGLDRGFRDQPAARLALSFLLGVTGTGWLMQALSLAGIRWSLPAILAAWLPVVLVAIRRRAAKRWGDAKPARRVVAPRPGLPAPPWARRAGLAALAAGAAVVAVQAWIPVPARANWDAWAIWGLKAKACWETMGIPFAFLADPAYRFSHPDYPNGIPAVQCFLGLFAGGLDEGLFRLLSVGHWAALLALVLVVLRDLGGGEWRWLLAGGLALVPALQRYGSLGVGEVPVAAWMVAGLAILVRAYAGAVPVWTVGLAAGLSTYAKDEGLLWGAGCLAAVAVWAARGKLKPSRATAAVAVCLVVVAPAKLMLAWLGIGPNAYVIDVARMLAAIPSRLPVVVAGYALEAWGPGATRFGTAGSAGPGAWFDHLAGACLILWYAVPVALALGWRWLRTSGHRELLLPFAFHLGGCLAVYLASTVGIEYHVVSTADRILVEFLPATLVLAASAALAAPPRRRVP